MNTKDFFSFKYLFSNFYFVSFSENEPTCAVRLGWDKDSRVIIFHIDDAGLCHGANQAIFESIY
jgi:hypothetical protein